MEYAEAGAAVESGLIEEATVVKACEDYLLVHLERGIAPLLLGVELVGRKHLPVNLVAHFSRYLRRVATELAFFPTST